MSLTKGPVVRIEDVQRMIKERSRVNHYNFRNITWTKDNKVLNIPKGTIDAFEMTGLSNVDFISSQYYRRKHEQI